jgi:hypothetical protein
LPKMNRFRPISHKYIRTAVNNITALPLPIKEKY